MDLAPKRLWNHLLPVNLDNEILEIYISNKKNRHKYGETLEMITWYCVD